MPVQKFVSEKIQVGVSDYVGIYSLNGGVMVFTLKELETPIHDWMTTSEQTVNVTSSRSITFTVPPLSSFNLNLEKLSINDEHLVTLSSSGTDINYPDIVVKNFEGDLPYSNKTFDSQEVSLTITPISSHSTSSYKIKWNPVYEWPMFLKNCVIEEDETIIQGYPSGQSGPYALWDNIRHQTAKLDFSFGYANGEVTAHKTLISNSYDSHAFILPYHFNREGISKVDILLTTSIQSTVGQYSIISKKSKIPDDIISLYDDYQAADDIFNAEIAEQKVRAGLLETTQLENISRNDASSTSSYNTSSGTSTGY